MPTNASTTALAAGLTGVAGALTFADLVDAVDSLEDVTIFAPNNAAFQDIASALTDLTPEDAASILQYHVVNGTVAYSSQIANGTNVTSMTGAPLNITIEDGEVFVNAARVITADVLIAGGVIHVIDSVLNPNSTIAPNPDSDEPVVQFEGAMEGDVPYTDGIPEPTGSPLPTTDAVAEDYPETPATTAGAATETSEDSAPRVTGAIGAAALFAGAAYMAI